MKRNASIGVIYLILFVGFSIAYWITWNFPQKKKIKTEYKIELTNKDSIKVYSVSNDTIYNCTMDKLVEVIEKDNL